MTGQPTEKTSEGGYNRMTRKFASEDIPMTTRHEYIEKLKTRLDEWDQEIDELEAKAQQTSAELKFELQDQIASLKLKRDQARLKISGIMDASEEAWEDLKQGVDEAWVNLREAIEKARSHYR